MSRLQNTELRRMRPCLGTFVEVRVYGLNEPDASMATDRAFARIATVEERMSAHDPNSDLGRLYNAGANEAVKVHPWTFEVIEAASRLYRLSDGIFDITVGDVLERKGLLPNWSMDLRKRANGTMVDIQLGDGNRVRMRRPTRLDLGGIAKGFAVDRAVEALIEARASGGCVNAGGDFRIFGVCPEPLLIRHPATPRRIFRAGEIQTGAVATSAGYFQAQRRRSTPVVDGRNRAAVNLRNSITVIAPSCMWSDALTKVFAVDPQRAEALLDQFSASAVLLSECNQTLMWRFLPERYQNHPCSTVSV